MIDYKAALKEVLEEIHRISLEEIEGNLPVATAYDRIITAIDEIRDIVANEESREQV